MWAVYLKNGTPHSRYFSDELGVPIILIDTEQMFALQRDAWYNINVNIVHEISKIERRGLYADCIQLWSRN